MLALLGAAAIFPPALLHLVGREQVNWPGTLHFGAVAATALAATAAGVALSVVALRRSDARAGLVGTAFTVMAGLLTIHGAATPGILVGQNGVIALAGAATLPVGGVLLALTALPGLRGPQAVKRLVVLQSVLFAGVIALGAVGLAFPSLVPSVPEKGSAAAYTFLVVGIAFYSLLLIRVVRTYLLARRTADLLVGVGVVWLAVALVAYVTRGWIELGFWLGHAFEIVGIAIVGGPVAYDLFRAAQSRPLAGDLRGVELVRREEDYLGSDVRALTRRLAEKDEYTEGHTRRVALLAVEVGEELGLSKVRLRALAIGALLHDVGKLAVPDAILKKPGPLDDDEYAVIRRHPARGERLVAELGFSARIRRLVLDHHERLDGRGYPNGRLAGEIDLDTRILTACDVYDALISNRVYRGAWTPEQALGLLRDESGEAFDFRCVDALERVLARSHGVVVRRGPEEDGLDERDLAPALP
jgi:putative nucleotidyltransferase with HDIG domain